MDAYFKAEWEHMKVSEDAKGYTGDELVEWEALKLENDMRFYPERFPERDAQILALVLPHLQGSMASIGTMAEEIGERLEDEDKGRFLAIPAAMWTPEGPAQKMAEDYFQTEEFKRAILRSTQGMSLEDVQEALRSGADWVQSLHRKADEDIRYALVDTLW